MRRLAPLLLLIGLLAAPAAARADAAALAGRWAGTAAGGRVELVVEPTGSSFTLRLVGAGRTLFDASFAPSERPGVHEATATGLFAMLGSRRAPANPLEGEELVWTRDLAGGLVVTRLAIAAGKPVIERARLVRSEAGVAVRVELLEGERMVAGLEAALARAGR